MEIVSEEVKSLLNRQFRNPCHCKVLMGIIEPTAVDESTLTDNNHSYFSNLNPVELGDVVRAQYGTLEDYFTPLNGVKELPREVNQTQVYQGYVSEIMSNGEGVYEQIPTITITTDTPIQTLGLTLTFDTISEDYPTKLRISTFVNSTAVEQIIVEPTSSEHMVEHAFEYFNKMTIEFLESNVPYRRARFTGLVYGISRIYDTSVKSNINNLISVSEEKEISLVNKNLPTFTMNFSINNIFGDFDTDNPTGLDEYFVENQPITYYWGIEGDDGKVNWILGGNVFTDGTIKATRDQLTISCTDRLSMLENTFIKGLYRPNGITLYDLAIEVLTDAGLTENDYLIDDVLKSYTTMAPLPVDTHKACLQLIAAASMCSLYTDRRGKICIEPFADDVLNYYLDLNMSINEPPKTTMIQKMKNMQSYYHTFSVGKDSREIASLETTLEGTEVLQIQYNNSTNVSATITGGTINSATYYTSYCELNVTANGDIEIKVNGKELITTQTSVDVDFALVGKTAEVMNPLICTYEHCMSFINFVATAIENRHIYETDFRGDPTLDVSDKIHTQTKFSELMPSRVTKIKTEFKGSFDGNVKFVKVNN